SAAELARRHPGLVVLVLSAWGHAGPWAGRRGFDSLVQAATGVSMAESADGRAPGVLPAQLLDHATGYLAAAGVLRALTEQRRTGGSWLVRLSLAQTAHWLLGLGRRPAADTAPPDPAPYVERLGRLSIASPPGRIGDQSLHWPGPPPVFGADPPSWRRG
ncbi:MAG: L-carnitine dehydratase/bile acid-inducible protein, partial [Pseudonocardia sp.]|nr:L-carnitine dehydratase/bile acid-inducible protein [Pseudonocardia sp.]